METTVSQPPLPITQPREPTARKVGLVMTYNQRETCIEAINSLLVQTLALDLIIVSDDCSTDGTYGVITEHFSKNGKPSNVELYQPEKNLGFIPHFNVLLKNHCRDDDLIFYNAGDDISEISRVEEFYSEYAAKGKPRHFLGHSYVTSFGSGTEEILVPPIESIKDNRELCLIASAYHIGASQVFTGALFFDFGPILFDDCYEDLTLGYRALLKNAYHFIPKAMLRYRIGGLSSWQQNPLEKKRGRLRSTLTQRAVDSMRSGDFEALAVIQDCYSQYGFSLKPHKDRIDIIVINDQSLLDQSVQYTISKDFSHINNVCATQQMSTAGFIKAIGNGSFALHSPLVWIVLESLSSENLLFFFEKLAKQKAQRIVLDTGLIANDSDCLNQSDRLNAVRKFLDMVPHGRIHSSSHSLVRYLNSYTSVDRISYLPPLLHIDGLDPKKGNVAPLAGLIVLHDTSDQALDSLKAITVACKTLLPSTARLDVLSLQTRPTQALNAEVYSSLNFINASELAPKLEAYGFMAILGNGLIEHHETTLFWWLKGAECCVPTFMNMALSKQGAFVHGRTCLFLSDEDTNWTAAINLLGSHYRALIQIGSEARKVAYFEHSVQKQIKRIASMIAHHVEATDFYNRFLPL